MNNMLPIGSVVQTSVKENCMMIIGYYPEGYDTAQGSYIGILYPSGTVGEMKTYAFNSSDVIEIKSRGYQDEEALQMVNLVSILMSQKSDSE